MCVECVVVGIEICEIPNFCFTSANSESLPGSSFHILVSVTQLSFFQQENVTSLHGNVTHDRNPCTILFCLKTRSVTCFPITDLKRSYKRVSPGLIGVILIYITIHTLLLSNYSSMKMDCFITGSITI